MSKLRANIGEAVFALNKWLGVNESPDGDSNLKKGEAAEMRNFRITDSGALKKRPGSKTVAGLSQDYTYEIGEERIKLYNDNGYISRQLVPNISLDSVGNPVAAGDPRYVMATEANDYNGWYHQSNGQFYQFDKIDPTGDTKVTEGLFPFSYMYAPYQMTLWGYIFTEPPRWGPDGWDLSKGEYVNVASEGVLHDGMYIISTDADIAENCFLSLEASGTIDPPPIKPSLNGNGWYFRVSDVTLTKNEYGSWTLKCTGQLYQQGTYDWFFRPVKVKSNAPADSHVRGLWSGFVGTKEYIVAACNGYLWSLAENEGVWSKTAIGPVNTNGRVCLFGFGGKLYCLDGVNYWCWDGASIRAISGYVPIIAVGSSPTGGGTLLERVNLLTPQRRQRFNGNGTNLTYQLLERDIASVDKVTVGGMEIKSYTANLATGMVIFTEAPLSGADNVEIWYSAKESYRDKITAMTYAEFYNGATDNRVFLYGDGSNVCRYSDIEYSGAPSAEYFPDLNEMAVGEANTPLTAMIRQYNRLLAFKRGGGAYSIYYSETALPDGNITAGFYCAGINKDLGCEGMGQSVLVENKPRTADGRSIYEWQGSSGGYVTNDQRNARRVSQNVEKSLGDFDTSKAKLFYDKINHEFYCAYGGRAVVQNMENEAWYIYTGFPVEEFIMYKDELYYGTAEGALRRFSDDYASDDGEPIDCYWESGSMSFGMDYVLKYSPEIWVGLKQEPQAAIIAAIETDSNETAEAEISAAAERDGLPLVTRSRLKARRFTFYKLIFRSLSSSAKATVIAADIKVKYNKNIK